MPSKRKRFVGLDIGRFALKAVWAEVSSQGFNILRAESLRLPSEGTDRSSVIIPWLMKMGIGYEQCVIGLPARQAMFQPFVLSPNDPRSSQQAVAMEVLRLAELASEEMNYDFATFALEPGERRIMLAMVRPSVLDELIGFTQQAGLNILDIVPTPIALYHALMPQVVQDSRPSLFINVGHATTEVAVGTPAGFLFGRFFNVGGAMFTEALARARQVTEVQAELLKTTEGILLEESHPLRTTLLSVAEIWAGELDSCLAVYRSLYPGEGMKPARVILCGGGSELRGFPEFVAKKLGTEVIVADPLGGSDVAGIQFAVAAGLVASQSSHLPVRISLLPERMRSELQFRRQKPFWIAAAVTGALIFGVSVVGGYRDIQRKEKQLGLQRASLARRQKLVAEIERVKAQTQQIREMAAPIHELLQSGATLRDLLELLANTLDQRDWITTIADAESHFAERSDSLRRRGPGGRLGRTLQSEVSPADQRLNRVIIEGYTVTRNLSTVKNLIKKLGAQQWVASADLLLDDELHVVEQRPLPAEGVAPERRTPFAQRFVLDVRLAKP